MPQPWVAISEEMDAVARLQVREIFSKMKTF